MDNMINIKLRQMNWATNGENNAYSQRPSKNKELFHW